MQNRNTQWPNIMAMTLPLSKGEITENMKKQYEKPTLTCLTFKSKDEIAASASGGIESGELPYSASPQDPAAFQLS